VVHETPLVSGALAHLVARVVRSSWGGDHSLFIGQVEYARYGEGRPLLFHGGRYERLLAGAPMLSTLPPEILDAIMAAGEERSYEPEQSVVREGEPGDELFVILDGEARIERGGNVLATFGPGEFFGEIAVLDGRPRSADVVAASALRCLTVSREVLREVLERAPEAAWAMLQILAGRLRED
jgi:signal-transduction protein with cAMP-binding, CBS, and nucleotidyltransferase domain